LVTPGTLEAPDKAEKMINKRITQAEDAAEARLLRREIAMNATRERFKARERKRVKQEAKLMKHTEREGCVKVICGTQKRKKDWKPAGTSHKMNAAGVGIQATHRHQSSVVMEFAGLVTVDDAPVIKERVDILRKEYGVERTPAGSRERARKARDVKDGNSTAGAEGKEEAPEIEPKRHEEKEATGEPEPEPPSQQQAQPQPQPQPQPRSRVRVAGEVDNAFLREKEERDRGDDRYDAARTEQVREQEEQGNIAVALGDMEIFEHCLELQMAADEDEAEQEEQQPPAAQQPQPPHGEVPVLHAEWHERGRRPSSGSGWAVYAAAFRSRYHRDEGGE
jgi:hypothetical protein